LSRLVAFYPAVALGALFGSAWYWTLLGAQVQQDNADQLANTYLFDHAQTFHAATLPDQHTFLFKWPLFLLIRLFGSTSAAFTAMTIAVTLATIAAFVYVLYRIDRRPVVFGTLCLALAAVLVAIPPEPYPGGILPVNMAMVTTRNLEYILFIGGLVLAVRAKRWADWRLAAAVVCMTLLIVSDKLFMTIGLGGGALALLFYAAVRNWMLCKAALRWLAVGAVSTGLAMAALLVINKTGLTHIAAGAVTGPYGMIHDSKELLLGCAYAVLALLTNFGANPFGDVRLFSQLPHELAASLTSVTGVVYIANALCLLVALVAGFCLLMLAGKRTAQRSGKPIGAKAANMRDQRDAEIAAAASSTATGVATLLIWSSVVAGAAFVLSNHYYAVDARYMTIALFALFVALAAYARSRAVRARLAAGAGVVLFACVLLGMGLATRTYRAERAALHDTNNRNHMVVQAIHQHPVDILVGDYWRVLPARLVSKNSLTVMPLQGCTQTRDVLSSKTWQPDLSSHSFAYLLTLDQSLTGYKPCTLQEVVHAYGAPNASVIMEGTVTNPHEMLLFYDQGAHKSAPKMPGLTTVGPLALANLAQTPCAGPTIMNIVAHQDDDLLFMNPDLLQEIRGGACIRTVYVTSGDAGTDKYYWLGREQGSEAAYNSMLNLNSIWVQRSVTLPGGQTVTVGNPRGDSRVSLIFMRLPDGNVLGQGFESTHHESLARLEKGTISEMHTSDQQSVYTSADLTQALSSLMETYQPVEVHTQANVVDHMHPDHSDHMAVGRYAQQAYNRYAKTRVAAGGSEPAIKFYIGYPIRSMLQNVTGNELREKENTFFAYARFDNGVCGTEAQCARGSVYPAYLTRQYQGSH